MIPLATQQQIRKLHTQAKPARDIARLLKISRQTVATYLQRIHQGMPDRLAKTDEPPPLLSTCPQCSRYGVTPCVACSARAYAQRNHYDIYDFSDVE